MPDAPAKTTDPAADLMSPEVIDALFPGHDGGVSYEDAQGKNKETVAAPKSSEKQADASEGKASDKSKPDAESSTAKADDATNPQTDSSEQAVDLKGIPGVLQAAIRALPAEKQGPAAKELREGYLRWKDWTQNKQGDSDTKKNSDAWKAAMADPELRKSWMDRLSKRGGSQEPSKVEDDTGDEKELERLIAEGTPKEWAAFLKKRDERLLAKAAANDERVYEEKVERPKRVFKDVESALQAHADENGIDYDAMRAAVRIAESYPTNGPLNTWDPEKAVDLVAPFIRTNGHATNKPNGAAPQQPPIPRVAPPGRGSGASAPAPLPAHRREGRPARTNQEQAEELAYLLTEQLGRPISVADLDAAR